MALGNRQVAEGEDEPVAEPLAHPAQDRLGAEAEGALEVAEHRPAPAACPARRGRGRASSSAGISVASTRTGCYARDGRRRVDPRVDAGGGPAGPGRRVREVPAPIVLVLGGLGIAFLPGLPEIELEPDTIFLVFLPPLVFSAGWRTSPRELRTVMRPLGLLSVGLVFITAGAVVAVVAHALVPELELGRSRRSSAPSSRRPTRSPRSPIFRRLGGPERVRLLVEGRVDDQRRHRAGDLPDRGRGRHRRRLRARRRRPRVRPHLRRRHRRRPARRGLSILVIRRQTDAGLVVVLTLLTAYGAYIGAEEVGVSGILAAVVAGLYGGYQSARAVDADTRLSAVAFWDVLIFALEISLFVLLGVQLPGVVDTARGQLVRDRRAARRRSPPSPPPRSPSASRSSSRSARRAGETRGERFAVGWSGMRGAVSLAAALAVPLSVSGRPQIIFLAFALILVTLVGQGLSLPFVVRALRAGGAATLVRRGGGGADGGGAGGARPHRRDRRRGARRRSADAAPARPLPGPLPHVPGRCWAARTRRSTAREQRLADYGALRRELIGDRARRAARRCATRGRLRRDDAPDRARPRPRGGADPRLSRASATS